MFDRAAFADTCSQRANIIEWLPFEKGQSVVIHSTVPSAVLDMLRSKEVQLQVMSEAHIEKLAMNPGKGSLDYIVLLGMEVNAEMLTGLYKKLKPEGRLVVLLHNKYGMSYLAGKPAYGQRYFTSVEGDACRTNDMEMTDASAKSGLGQKGDRRSISAQAGNKKSAFYSLKGLEKLVKQAGILQFNRYYADPEGAYAVNIYSDDYLPKAGDCNLKARNFTYDRLEMFDEAEALNSAVKEEMFPEFANDYLLVTGPKLSQVMIRYSNDRAVEYQIRTEVCQESGMPESNTTVSAEGLQDGESLQQGQSTRTMSAGLQSKEALTEVRKTPLHPEGLEHVKRMEQTYAALCEQYDEEVFTIVPCTWNGRFIAFPFVRGVALSELMQEALQRGDEDTVFTLFHMFLNKLRSGKKGNFANYDFIFSNILIDGDRWQVIDYEWTVDRAVTAEELAFRAAYCFSLEHEAFPFEDICRILDLDKKDVQRLMEKETAYQKQITGGQPSVEALCASEGGDRYTGEQVLRALELRTEDNRVQIYEDSGRGFSEEQSYFIEHALTRYDEMELALKISAGMKAVRIDPCEEPCLMQIKRLWWNGKEEFLDKTITVNGLKGKAGKNSYAEYIFATRDPNFTVPLDKLAESDLSRNELKIQLEIHKISLQLANTLTKSMKRII
ncbi:MAG: hypothetical protein IJZ84_05770 [Lachnospiraceae bacterium]|nr:hypothetical protein [Lachnospiraceae bacterium]